MANKVIFLMGATGTGKSQLAIDLSRHLPLEIVNADSMLVYRGGYWDGQTHCITTTKCVHHLIDIRNPWGVILQASL